MKQFILEFGKDFLFMDQEYCLEVGASTFKADLLSSIVAYRHWWRWS